MTPLSQNQAQRSPILVTRYDTRLTGSGNASSGWQLSPVTVIALSDSKLQTTRRVKPKGTEVLFQGTSVWSSRERYNTGTYQKVTTFSDGYWVGTQQLVEGKVNPQNASGQVVGYTSSDWGNKLRTRLIDISLNLGETFGERKQTAKLFSDYGNRILRAYKALRKGDPNGVYRALTGLNLQKGWKSSLGSDLKRKTRRVADEYLAFQYGVRPLVSELAGAVSLYLDVRGVRPIIRRVHITLPKRYGYGKFVDKANELTDVSQVYLKGHVVCYADFQMGDELWTTAQRAGLTNPALLLWELTTLSFVFDWFLNVGDFLSASETPVGLKRLGIHVVSTKSILSSRTQYGGFGTYSQKYASRDFQQSLPGATLRFGTGINSATRLMSSLALVRQRIK